MADATIARLGGVPLLSDPPVRWESKAGVRPSEGTFSLRRDDLPTLLTGGFRPLTLEIDDRQGRVLKVNFLYVIAEEPREHPEVARVRVVDRRWFWSYVHVSRNFNKRRVVGIKRRRTAGVPPELDPLTPEIAFHPATLRDGALWKAEEVLENVLAHALRGESRATGFRANLMIDPTIGNALSNLPMEDIELEDSGDNAVARVLKYLPEAQVRVDKSGTVRVYSRVDGQDAAMVQSAKPELYGQGHVHLISNARLRPRKINVIFTRQHEVRFDFEETSSPTTTEGARSISNVLPVPDFSLTLASNNANEPGRTVDQGTWITLVEAFDAWRAPPRQDHLTGAGPWFAALRQLMVPYLDLWTGIGLSGVRDPDADWMGRIGAIQEHYRRTWRISPRWMSHIAQLEATLIATVDPATGTRAPALVYCDYARLASQRSIWKDKLDDAEATYAMNVQGYPASGQLTEGRSAPFELSIVDVDQGIIHYDYRPDPFRVYEQSVPGMIGLGTTSGAKPSRIGPTWDIDDTTRPIAFNAISDSHDAPQLTTTFKVAVLLTAVPATRNSQQNLHLYTIERKAEDVQKFLPATMRGGASLGPDLDIRIGANIETARVSWVDDAASDIEKSFGVIDGFANIDDLIVNLEGDAAGGASLAAIADAVAAKTYAMFSDRFMGENTVAMFPQAEVAGHIESVSHEVTTGGAAVTNIKMPEKLTEIDIFSLLPDSTRRLILRLAPSPGKVNAG